MLNQETETAALPEPTTTPTPKKPATSVVLNPNAQLDLKSGSVEAYYGESCMANPDIRSLNQRLYRWQGDHWAIQDREAETRNALKWLVSNAKKRANTGLAKSCADTAIYLVDPLPPKSPVTIVPVKGAWLTIQNDGLVAQLPDREVGICHRINSDTTIPLGPYTPKAVPADSLFGRYIETALPDPEVRACVQDYVGYTLTNSTAFQCAQFWVGGGSNGKSVLANIVRELHAKAVSMQIDKLSGFELAAIVGASLVTVDEAADKKVNQQVLKSIISGGAIGINPKYDGVFTYAPTAKWLICGNHLPQISDTSKGWWRRFQVVEWTGSFEGKEKIAELDKKIIATEMHIALDWALEGLRRVVSRNYEVPPLPAAMVKAQFDAVISSNDVLGWVHERGVVVTPGRFTDKEVIWNHYGDYVRRKGRYPLEMNAFFKKLKAALPKMNGEGRITVGSGVNKRRPWCADVMWGNYADEDPVGVDEPADPFEEEDDKGLTTG